jgi:hypothetical protein
MEKRNWGGLRAGAGRPVSNNPKRTRRAIEYFDEEWELIRSKAQTRGLSIREYLYSLVEKDQP